MARSRQELVEAFDRIADGGNGLDVDPQEAAEIAAALRDRGRADSTYAHRAVSYRGVTARVEVEDSPDLGDRYVLVSLYVDDGRMPGGLDRQPYSTQVKVLEQYEVKT